MKIADYAKGNKKTLKKKALIALIITIVSVIMMVVFSIIDIMAVAAPFIVLGVIAFVKWIQYHNGVKRLDDINCACGNKYTYPNDVKYELSNPEESRSKSNDNIKVIVRQMVKFTCVCPKCGKEKKFNFKFIISERTENVFGAVLTKRDYPVEDQIKKYFA